MTHNENEIVACEVCSEFRFSLLKSRNICSVCYNKESISVCLQCKQSKHKISRKTRLCPSCTKDLERFLCGEDSREIILCGVCHRKRHRYLKNREICNSCYFKEPRAKCTRCGLPKRLVSNETGLCPKCEKLKPQLGEGCLAEGEIVCEVCGELRRAFGKRNICIRCYLNEPVIQCSRCKKLKHLVSEETGLCPTCTKAEARPKDICKRCARLRIIHNQQEWFCKICHDYVFSINPARVNRSKIKVKCSSCNNLRPSALESQDICIVCYTKIRNSGLCSKCNKSKTLVNKSKQLCHSCAQDEAAKRRLAKYVEEYATPYSYNKFLFELLVHNINWNLVKYAQATRFRVFGRFLFSHQLPEPLTWKEIDDLLEKILPDSSNTLIIRSCINDLGHILAKRGILESYETYSNKRRILLKISQSPKCIQPILNRYLESQIERKMRLRSVYNNTEVLVRFWLSLAQIGIELPAQVQPSHVESYLQTLYWQWQCSKCEGITVPSFSLRQGNESCSQCGEKEHLILIERYAQKTVCCEHSSLKGFFGWAKLEKMAFINPVQGSVKMPDPKIIHYPFETVKSLCQYILNPLADPTEALILYLIIFHALSPWELNHAEIPILHVCKSNQMSSLASAYFLNLPEPEPSRGDHSPGRFSTRLDFHPSAAIWLKPLLERFEKQRQQRLKNPQNRYLFITPTHSRHCRPVSKGFLLPILQRASLRAIGAICTIKTLRITAAVMHIDQADGGILTYMGWSSDSAFFYSWGPREVIHPRQVDLESEASD